MIERIAGKMNSVFTRLFLCLRALRVKRMSPDPACVMIAQGGNVGDALMNAAAIISTARYYKEKEKRVFLICSEASWNILQRIPGMELVEYIGGPKKQITFQTAYRLFSKLKPRCFGMTIAFMCRETKWALLALGFSPDTVMYRMPSTGNAYKQAENRLFLKLADIIPDHANESRFKQAEKLLHRIGNRDYKASIAYIPRQSCEIKHNKEYITISVDSSTASRRWSTEKFIALIRRLLSMFAYDIVLMGSSLSEQVIDQYRLEFRSCGRVQDMIGKTSIAEWIELIRGSKFLIGVDSGSIHVAASVGTVPFCLTGVWDARRFVPYNLDILDSRTVEPICIIRDDADGLACYDCYSRGGMGKPNAECLKRCRKNQPCLCLEKIRVDDVIDVIEKARIQGTIC